MVQTLDTIGLKVYRGKAHNADVMRLNVYCDKAHNAGHNRVKSLLW
jgi:hypothetical protein